MFCLPLQDKRKVWKITLALCLPNHFFVIAAKDSTTSDPVDKVEFKSPGSRILGAGKNIYLGNLVGYYIVHDPFWRTNTSLRRLVLESPCIHRPIYIFKSLFQQMVYSWSYKVFFCFFLNKCSYSPEKL